MFMDKHLPLSSVCVFLIYVYDFNFTDYWHTFIWHMFVFNLLLLSQFNLLHTSLQTFITIRLYYFYQHTFEYTVVAYIPHFNTHVCYHTFILLYLIYFLNIDVFNCMDVRRIGCWSPVVTSLAYILTVYISCYYNCVCDMYCIHQDK